MSVSAVNPYSSISRLLASSGITAAGQKSVTAAAAQATGRIITDTITLSPQAQALLAAGSTSSSTAKAGLFGVTGLYSSLVNTTTINGSGLDFAGDNLAGLTLQNAVFTNADLRGTNFAGSNLQGANLQGAQLNGAVLVNTDLRGADLSGASGVTAAQIYQARLDASTTLPQLETTTSQSAATLPAATGAATSADYSYQFQPGSDFSQGQLQGASFAFSNVSQSNFLFANLSGADFTGANVTGANFAFADLSGANLSNAVGLTPSQLSGATTDFWTQLPWSSS